MGKYFSLKENIFSLTGKHFSLKRNQRNCTYFSLKRNYFSLTKNHFALTKNDFPLKENEFPLKKNKYFMHLWLPGKPKLHKMPNFL